MAPLLAGLLALLATGCTDPADDPAAPGPTTAPAAAPTPSAAADRACVSAVAGADATLEQVDQHLAVLAKGTAPPAPGRVGRAVEDLGAALDRCAEAVAGEATPSADLARRAAAAVDLLARSLRARDAEEVRFALDRSGSAIAALRRALPATSGPSTPARRDRPTTRGER